ncbi:putative acrylyl-CoA reductase AcuI [invertebrate metagenome]|uniref:Putative acrylyl-CoA reductase AcuI n=1 Tax=invertebrate metagenome TaxID=1711999 RepID=A0A2H9T2C6_9ZZZZ
MFKALVLNVSGDRVTPSIQSLPVDALPEQEILINVNYSTLNYKDALVITGEKTGRNIVSHWPMVPGIDFSGTIKDSNNIHYPVGKNVILTGWGVGERYWGGLSEKARVKGDWLVPTPEGLDNLQSMMIGTAGLTAMLCIMALEKQGIRSQDGEILVTGASGGVGSTALTLLKKLGYQAVAVTGRPENEQWLKDRGAERILLRDEFLVASRLLEKQQWAGAIDTAGNQILAKVLSQIKYGGAVAACGLASGFQLPTTVMPFILRNIALLGIDSVMCSLSQRKIAWNRLSSLLPATYYEQTCTIVSLENVVDCAHEMMKGKITGRIVVHLSN